MSDVRWEYQVSARKWCQYDEDFAKILNEAPPDDDSIEKEVEESNLQFDFVRMRQQNLDSGFERSIRCTVPAEEGHVAWEWQNTNRRWVSFRPTATIELENAKQNGESRVTLQLNGTQAQVDLDVEQIFFGDGDIKADVRRSVSRAEPADRHRPLPSEKRRQAMTRVSTNVAASAATGASSSGASKASTSVDKKKMSMRADAKPPKRMVEDEEVLAKKSRLEKVFNEKVLEKVFSEKVDEEVAAEVDSDCAEKVGVARVYSENGDYYDAMLNQTNIAQNNNKYYLMQLLEDKTGGNYSVWFRWGRVGYSGQKKLTEFGDDLAAAKEMFTQKFYDKTLNPFEERKEFVKVHGKYDLVQIDRSKKKNVKKEPHTIEDKENEIESKLDERLQHLMQLITDMGAMEKALRKLDYDTHKAPLGNITKAQLRSGYEALTRIEKCILEKKFGNEFNHAMNDYYTRIPHFHGMSALPPIKTLEELRKELALLEALSEVEETMAALAEESTEEALNPLDKHYRQLKCKLEPLEPSTTAYKLIDKYLQQTHAPSHLQFKMRLRNVFAVEKEGEREQFRADLGNKQLLWHGSRMTNWYGILLHGLRIAPPEAPTTGYMFGKGVYAADSSSKSANYCYPQQGVPGLMVLSEFALGETRDLFDANFEASELADGKHSTRGLGGMCPDPEEVVTIDGDVKVPCGKLIDQPLAKENETSLLYNEYIVYDTKQIRMRYLVEVDFIFESLL